MKKTVHKGMMSRQQLWVWACSLLGSVGVMAAPVGAVQGAVTSVAAKQQVAASAPVPAEQQTAPVAVGEDQVEAESQADVTGQTALDTSKDPSENFNRAMFTFNEKVDDYIARPVGEFYNKIMPKPLNLGIHNFFNNIDTLPTIANDILQVNIYQMANDMWRFGVNTTVGIGGLFDVGTRINLRYYTNDFGLTMAAYGYDESSYLVLPFWGPRTWRDMIGMPVDFFVFSIYPHIQPQSLGWQLYGLSVVDWRAQALRYQNVLEEAAIDKYVFMRDAYMQRRAAQIKENQHLGYDERTDQPIYNSEDIVATGV